MGLNLKVDISSKVLAMAVGIFDSGLGGLTVLEAVTKKIPKESFVYMGDNLHAPYGVRESSDIFDLTIGGLGLTGSIIEVQLKLEQLDDKLHSRPLAKN